MPEVLTEYGRTQNQGTVFPNANEPRPANDFFVYLLIFHATMLL